MTLTYKTLAGVLVVNIEDKKIITAALDDINLPLNILRTPHFLNLEISEHFTANKTYIVSPSTIDGAPFTQAIRALKSYIYAKQTALSSVEKPSELLFFLPQEVTKEFFKDPSSKNELEQQIENFISKTKETLCHL